MCLPSDGRPGRGQDAETCRRLLDVAVRADTHEGTRQGLEDARFRCSTFDTVQGGSSRAPMSHRLLTVRQVPTSSVCQHTSAGPMAVPTEFPALG